MITPPAAFSFAPNQTVFMQLFEQMSRMLEIYRKEGAALGVIDAAMFLNVRQNLLFLCHPR